MLTGNPFFITALNASPTGRALLVVALLISAYALVRYWRSLEGRSGKIRYTLVSLRAVALVLMSIALSGVTLEYERSARARVLLRRLQGGVEADSERRQSGNSVQAIAALRARGFEIVEDEAEYSIPTPAQDGGFVAGVLLTDGMANAFEAERAVEGLNVAAGGAPVFVFVDEAAIDQPGVTLEDVSVLGNALRGVPLGVRCRVRARGMSGRESLVTVADDAKVQASARVLWTSDDEQQVVTLAVVPKVAGWIDYSAKIEAAGIEDAAGRVRPFTVYAEERRLRVLFFESEPTWEAKFIRRALEQAGLFEVDYSAQVSRAAAVGISEDALAKDEEATKDAARTGKKSASPGTPEAKLRAALQSIAQLNTYDCVIVGATENSLLSPAESARLREWVERRGGGLILLGGNSFNGSIVAPGGKLSSLLPAEIGVTKTSEAGQEVARGRPLEAETSRAGTFFAPTEAGAGGALSGYLNASAETQAKTAMLTGQGLRLGQLRPGASVLAVGARAGANGTSEEGAPLVAAMRYGAGRTLLFAPADSWRIRTSASVDENGAGGAFNALWQGLVLWTAAGARPPVEIVLSDASPAEGSFITAEIRARDAMFAPMKIEKLSARLQPLTEDAGDDSDATASSAQPREPRFAPDPSDESVWRARFPSETLGRFALEIEYTAGGQNGRVEKFFTVVNASPYGAGASLDTWRRASREKGGELISAADTAALTERLSMIPSGTESVRHRLELRSWWPLAFLIPLILSTEWFARRWWRED